MIFFTYCRFNKDLKIGIDMLVPSVSIDIASHRSSWLYMLKNQLENEGYNNVKVLTKNDKWDDYEAMMLYYGSSYNDGNFSTFGQYDEVRHRILQFQNYRGILMSLHNRCANISRFVLKHKSIFYDYDLDKIEENIERSIVISNISNYKNIIVGDSHATSVYRPQYLVSRNNFNTLYGALKKGLESYLPFEFDHAIFNFGNIDLRHHLMRRENPIEASLALYQRYINQVVGLIERGKIKRATIVEPLYIEHEDRRISKMGLYRGEPFYGTREERLSLRDKIKSLLRLYEKKNKIKVFRWPLEWEKLSGEEFAFQYMERPPKSVHLSRSGYYWDFENNCKNKLYE